jgi:hypothetical protein
MFHLDNQQDINIPLSWLIQKTATALDNSPQKPKPPKKPSGKPLMQVLFKLKNLILLITSFPKISWESLKLKKGITLKTLNGKIDIFFNRYLVNRQDVI